MTVPLTLEVDFDRPALSGTLLYLEGEYSFKFDARDRQEVLDRAGNDGVTSLSVGTLQVEVGVETGIALFVWGFHPHLTWEDMRLAEPRSQPGQVRLSDPRVLARGVALQASPDGAWSTWRDPQTGWISVAPEPGASGAESHVLIADGVVLGLRDGALSSVWLRPAVDGRSTSDTANRSLL
jgi:hypothetical protein